MSAARTIETGSPFILAQIEDGLATITECLDLEATHHVHSGQTRDHKAAARAFVEKCEPKFEGR
jgi:hypothetical protein